MIRPDDEDKPFVGRWNSLIRILLVESSVKHVARAVMDYADLFDGSKCRPSVQRIARETGYSKPTVLNAWATIRYLGLAERVSHGSAHRKRADEYQLLIPERWYSLPVLGPKSGKFTCLYCGKLFTPDSHSVLRKDKSVGFQVKRFCFCPSPRQKKGRPGDACGALWDKERAEANEESWDNLGNEVWGLFRQAREDDW